MYTRSENRARGKFEGVGSEHIARVLYNLCGISGQDEETRSNNTWYGLIKGKKHWFIVYEDNQGFFDYDLYITEEDVNQAWLNIVLYCEESESCKTI